MLNKKNFTICLIACCSLGYAQEFNTQLGSVKYKVNPDNSISYLGSNLHYKFSDFAYQADLNKTSTTHNFAFNTKIWSANFMKTVGLNSRFVSTLKFKDFSMVDQQLINNRVQSFSYQNKNTNIDYIKAENKMAFLDYWKRNISSKTYLSLSFHDVTAKLIDSYYDLGYSNKNVSLKRIYSPTQYENNIQLNNKLFAMKWSNFDNSKYSKNFLELAGKGINFKSVNDANLNAEMLSFGNTIIAHNQTQNFVQSKLGDLTYKVAQSSNATNYSLIYKNISFNDKQWFYTANPNKNISFQLGSDRKVHNVNFNSKIKDTNVTLKYTDKFDVYDFYFNQIVFSIYDNNFNMIGKSKTQYKDATTLMINNPKYSFNVDAINNLWNVNLKANKEFTLGYLKDQKNHYVNLADGSKYGNLLIGYNLQKERVDKLGINFNFKF